MRTRFLAPFAALCLAACGGVYSTHPASDETNTRFDERLIGLWRVDTAVTRGFGPAGRADVLAGGRAERGKDALRVAALSVDEHRVLTVFQHDLAPTTIGGSDHASVRFTQKVPAWIVLRYELDGDVLRVLGMDEGAVAKDVNAGAIAGRASEPKPGESVRTATLEATTPALRAWLEKRGDALWKKESPLVLRRLKLE